MKTAVRDGPVAAVWALVALGTLVVGCGEDHSARLPIWGTVSCATREKLNGSITFLPAKGKPGPAATTSLVDGEYHFDRNNGPTAGPHRVIVNKFVPKDAMLKSLAFKTSPASREAPVARGDKTVWTLSADVPTEAPYQCDFKLAE